MNGLKTKTGLRRMELTQNRERSNIWR